MIKKKKLKHTCLFHKYLCLFGLKSSTYSVHVPLVLLPSILLNSTITFTLQHLAKVRDRISPQVSQNMKTRKVEEILSHGATGNLSLILEN